MEVTESLSDKVFVGQNIGGIEIAPKLDQVTKVILMVDEENYFEAGDDTGRTMEVTCPYGTQEMANNILAALNGYQYQPATATDALMDPAAEIGDAITMDGLYTVIARMDNDFDALMTSDVGAPGQEEIESEYPYLSQQTTETNRKLAETRSLITKTSEKIMLKVEELEGDYTELSVTIDGVTIKNSSGQTLIKGSSIDTSTIKANSITADKLNLTGSISFGDLDSEVEDKINDAYNTANDNKLPDYIKSTYIDQTEIRSPNIAGGKFLSPNEETWIEMGTDDTSAGYIGYLDLYVDGYSGSTPMFQVYCRSQGSTTRAIAMRATGSDFLVVDANYDIVTPLLTWDFSQAEKVTGLYLTFS